MTFKKEIGQKHYEWKQKHKLHHIAVVNGEKIN